MKTFSINKIQDAIDSDINFNFSIIDKSNPLEITRNIVVLSEEPKIYIIDNFITHEECDHFIAISQPNLQRALVSSNTKGSVSKGRTGKNYWLQHNIDNITKSVGNKIANQVGVPLNTAEQYQVIYYDKTEEYKQHYDSWDHDGSEKSKRCMKYGGQRLFTALCYLNDVEEGGHTRFTKLNLKVEAKKGRLLVFENVFKDTNKKHPLSEHAGTPVIKGEKWAFNLWFREESRNNIVYDPDNDDSQKIDNNIQEKTIENTINKLENISLNIPNDVFNFSISNNQSLIHNNFISEEDMILLLNMCNFKPENNLKRISCWGVNNDVNIQPFIKKISDLLHIDSSHFENINFIQYSPQYTHSPHFDAYDFTTEQGRKCYKTRGLEGQRIITVTGVLSENIEYNFLEHNKKIYPHKSSILVYNNVIKNTNSRCVKTKKSITNLDISNNAILFHLYIREQNAKGESLIKTISLNRVTNNTTNTNNIIQKKPTCSNNSTMNTHEINEDYKKTLDGAYENIITNNMKSGYKSLLFLNKINWDSVTNTLTQLNNIRDSTHGILNKDLLTNTYKFDEFNPVIQNDVIIPQALSIVQKYINDAILNKEIDLGDRQSNRYKARNETITRFLHYEILPLIQKITSKPVKPTYTYLSCYTKDSDLPPHTDQADCEFTVSFIIQKPENTYWPIYLHKTKQEIKHKGRYHFTPPKDECISCDCNSGGLMIFSGTDHIHYREALEHDYYNIVLLHYRV